MADPIAALIVDDEPLARAGLHQLLARDARVRVVGEAATGREAIRKCMALRPDLVLLDVQMPRMDGFAVAEALRQAFADSTPEVVFVTAHDAHALRAFDARALDYVLKPVHPQRLTQAVDRVAGRLGARPTPMTHITVRIGARALVLRADEIDWIGGHSCYARLHVGPKSYLVRHTMTALERRLDPERFARIHRSTIVNLDRVAEVASHDRRHIAVLLRGGQRLLVSRRRRSILDGMLH